MEEIETGITTVTEIEIQPKEESTTVRTGTGIAGIETTKNNERNRNKDVHRIRDRNRDRVRDRDSDRDR